jgi:hypothetical protein
MVEQIDKEITKQLDELKGIVDDLKFTELCSFEIKKDLDEIPWDELRYQGLYFFEVKIDNTEAKFQDWLLSLKEKWEHPKYFRKFTPNFKKKRIKAHSVLKDWMPLYLGKSKNIMSRVKEHIFMDLDKKTYAMKLRSRDNLPNLTLRLSTIKLDVINYDAILPKIESQLRDRINPLIGNQ